jgi:hypothetical protein
VVSSVSSARRPAVVVLAVVGCLLAIVSVFAVWGRNQVLNTDRYLATVVPLAADPAIQDEISKKVSTAIIAKLDAADRAEEVLPAQAGFLAAPMGEAVNRLVTKRTTQFVHSDAFQKLWRQLNSVGHQQLVDILNGSGGRALAVKGGKLQLDLGKVVDEVRTRLVDAGLTIVASMPPITLVVDIADAQGIDRARTAVHRLDQAANILPFVAIACLAGAAALSRRRLRSSILVLEALMSSMVLVRLVVASGVGFATRSVPADTASPDAVKAFYAQLTARMQEGVVLVGLLAAVVAAVLVAIAPIRAAVAHRSPTGAAWPATRGVARHAVTIVAGVVLLLADPSVTTTVVTLAVAGLLWWVIGRRGEGALERLVPPSPAAQEAAA